MKTAMQEANKAIAEVSMKVVKGELDIQQGFAEILCLTRTKLKGIEEAQLIDAYRSGKANGIDAMGGDENITASEYLKTRFPL